MSEGSNICLQITKHEESFQSLTGSSVSGKEIRKRYVQRNIYKVIPVVMTWPWWRNSEIENSTTLLSEEFTLRHCNVTGASFTSVRMFLGKFISKLSSLQKVHLSLGRQRSDKSTRPCYLKQIVFFFLFRIFKFNKVSVTRTYMDTTVIRLQERELVERTFRQKI